MHMVELLRVLNAPKQVNLSIDNIVGQGLLTHYFRKKY